MMQLTVNAVDELVTRQDFERQFVSLSRIVIGWSQALFFWISGSHWSPSFFIFMDSKCRYLKWMAFPGCFPETSYTSFKDPRAVLEWAVQCSQETSIWNHLLLFVWSLKLWLQNKSNPNMSGCSQRPCYFVFQCYICSLGQPGDPVQG